MAHGAPGPDASKFARCAAIAAADERLACYDQLARSTAPAPKPAPSASRSPASVAGDQDSGKPASPAARAAPSPPPTPAPAPVSPARPFGLTTHVVEDAGAPSSITAVVSRIYEDRLSNESVLLDNGQLWAVNESGAPLREGDAVTIRRAALGSFL